MKKFLLGVALLAFFASLSASFGKILFQENFHNYNDKAPNVNPAINPYVDNDPIWVRGANLTVRPEKGGDLFLKPIALPKGNRFVFSFDFKLLDSVPAKEAKGTAPAVAAVPSFFDVAFVTTDGRKAKTVRVAAEQVAEKKIAWISNGEWRGLAVLGKGKAADVFYAQDRAFVKVATIDLPADVTGLNLVATEKKNFVLGNMLLTDGGKVPSHPAQDHFAAFESLRQPIANAMIAGANGDAVSLNPAPRAGLRFIPGTSDKSSMELAWDKPVKGADGLVTRCPISITTRSWSPRVDIGWLGSRAKTELPDANVSIKGLCELSVRPDPKLFSDMVFYPAGIDIIRDWKLLPSASVHPVDVDFVRLRDGCVEAYVDGSLCKTFGDAGATVTNIAFRFAPGVKYAVKKDALAKVDTDRFTVIDLSANPRAKAFVDAKSSLKAGLQNFDGVPIAVAAPIDSADVALAKPGAGAWGGAYQAHSPMDGFSSEVHYRLSPASYANAHILFALDPDPAKDKILTVRFSYYANGIAASSMFGDAVLDFSAGKIPESCKKVGSVKKGDVEVPVYRMKVPLATGDVLDLLSGEPCDEQYQGGYIDFEFVGRCGEILQQNDERRRPDPGSDSAFNIFGVTLEKVPVKILARQFQRGNIFTADEKDRKTAFDLVAQCDDVKGKVSWTAKAVDGAIVFQGAKDFAIAKAGATNSVEIALDGARDVGYYTLDVVFEDTKSHCRLPHRAVFAVLPPAGRQVSQKDSPYGVWWALGTDSLKAAEEPDAVIIRKAGLARAYGAGSLKSADYKKLGLTSERSIGIQLPSWNAGKKAFNEVDISVPDPADPTGKKMIRKRVSGEEAAEHKLREALAKDPLIDTVFVWHDSGAGCSMPEELLGLPLPKGEPSARAVELVQATKATARIVRKLSKELNRKLRVQIDSFGAGLGPFYQLHRAGLSPDDYDVISIESYSQTVMPERFATGAILGTVFIRDMAAYYGKKDVPLNGSFEFIYRCDRDIGTRKQAEWYMRDILMCLANGFDNISPGYLLDSKGGFHHSPWGGSGFLYRTPFYYPKPSYVAYAVLTSVLDGVTFVRQLDTGSTTVYALEFKRMDGKTVTALWAARGEVDFELNSRCKGEAVHMLGRKEPVAKGVSTIRGGTAPTYVVTDKPLKGVRIAGRSFEEDEAIAKAAKVAWAIDDASAVTLDPDPAIESPSMTGNFPVMKRSDFIVKQVQDEEKGPCVEVSLDLSKNKDTCRYVTEYTTLRFKEPKLISGKPAVIGVWVKGNSNWGQLRFEIEDAQGEVFKNLTTGPSWGCDVMDWPGNLAVNFDGWGYVYSPLIRNTLVKTHSPGPVNGQWVSEGGDKKIDFPIKVRAITVGMNRQKLGLFGFSPSAPSIRLRDVGGTENP